MSGADASPTRAAASGEPFRVSVIVPVYRAEAYVREAVASALAALDRAGVAGEVILIEDGSPDGSLAVCRELAAAFDRVRLLRHADGANRGAGASRNRGIAEARHPWVAFLDADDVFTETRFVRTAELAADPTIDGVYEAAGVFFDRGDNGSHQHQGNRNGAGVTGVGRRRIMPVRAIRPERLFDRLVFVTLGTFHTLGVTLRRSLVEAVGGFPEELALSQDTALWIKAAAAGRLVPGEARAPVALYRRHPGNRSFRDRLSNARAGLQRWRHLARWSREAGRPPRQRALLRARLAFAEFECRCLERGGWAATLGPRIERGLRYLPKPWLARYGHRLDALEDRAPP